MWFFCTSEGLDVCAVPRMDPTTVGTLVPDYVPPMSNVLVLELTGVGSVREVFMIHVGGTRGVT